MHVTSLDTSAVDSSSSARGGAVPAPATAHLNAGNAATRSASAIDGPAAATRPPLAPSATTADSSRRASVAFVVSNDSSPSHAPHALPPVDVDAFERFPSGTPSSDAGGIAGAAVSTTIAPPTPIASTTSPSPIQNLRGVGSCASLRGLGGAPPSAAALRSASEGGASSPHEASMNRSQLADGGLGSTTRSAHAGDGPMAPDDMPIPAPPSAAKPRAAENTTTNNTAKNSEKEMLSANTPDRSRSADPSTAPRSMAPSEGHPLSHGAEEGAVIGASAAARGIRGGANLHAEEEGEEVRGVYTRESTVPERYVPQEVDYTDVDEEADSATGSAYHTMNGFKAFVSYPPSHSSVR